VAASTGHKVLVSVHGVGDQFNYETIQSVALRLSAYYGERSPIALGSFYQINAAGGARVMMNLPARGLPANVGFGEVYWADIPRRIIKEGYQLEESKKWAKTIVGRVAANARQGALEPNQVLLIENVLEELIDTVAILERLCFIAEKAGVFTFSLQRVLAEFVNDVQLVADFPRYREEVLHQFDGVMDTIAQQPMRPDMYLITHSEGTVVMLAGLLRALRKVPQPDWLGQLRGIMTIGSPLDTHMLLWPEMWSPRDGNAAWRPATAIPWFNYYDRGVLA
jgi:hypothetical protein